MTTIRRANHYVSYFIALVISGLFSLAGRPGPAWAEERKAEHNAQVFQQLYAGDPSGERSFRPQRDDTTTTRSIGADKSVISGDPNRTIFGNLRTVDVDKTIMVGGAAEAYRIVNAHPLNIDTGRDTRFDAASSVKDALRTVNAKIQNKEALNTEDTAFLLSAETAASLNQLSNQLNVLIKMVKELQETVANDSGKE